MHRHCSTNNSIGLFIWFLNICGHLRHLRIMPFVATA
jgi:hypothetical protein